MGKKNVSKGTASKGNKNKHKKTKSVGISGSVSDYNTNNDNVNNDNKQFGFINWIAMKILEFLKWLGIKNVSVKNNKQSQNSNNDEIELDFDNLFQDLISGNGDDKQHEKNSYSSNTSLNTSSNMSSNASTKNSSNNRTRSKQFRTLHDKEDLSFLHNIYLFFGFDEWVMRDINNKKKQNK